MRSIVKKKKIKSQQHLIMSMRPLFTFTAKGEKSGIFKKSKVAPIKLFTMKHSRLTKRKVLSPQEKASFVSF